MALTNLSQITTSGIATGTDLNIRNITGVAATFTGNVTVGGTLTYDDVTNIDSVGLITARSGINVTGGDVNLTSGNLALASATPMVVASNGSGSLRLGAGGSEKVRIKSDGKVGINSTTPRAIVDFGPGTGNGTLNQTVANYQAVFEAPTGTGNYTRNIAFASRTSAISAAINAVDEGGSDATGLIVATGTAGSIAERLRVTSGGRLLLGTTTEGQANADNLTIADSANCGITIRSGNTSGGAIYFSDGTSGGAEYDGYFEYSHNSRYMRFGTATQEQFRIDSSGRLLLRSGTTASTDRVGGFHNALQVEGTSATSSSVAIIRNSNDQNAAYLNFGKSRGTSLGSNTAVSAGDTLAIIAFTGSDGSGSFNSHASIQVNVDGATGNGDSPGRISFWTTPDGSASSTEKLTIKSDGKIGINETSPDSLLHLTNNAGAGIRAGLRLESSGTNNSANDTMGEILFAHNDSSDAGVSASIVCKAEDAAGNTYLQFNNGKPSALVEHLRITSAGDMGLGTATPTSFGPTFQVAGTDPALLLQDTATAVDYFGVNVASGVVNTWFDDSSAFVIHTATGISGSGLVERFRIRSDGRVAIGTQTINTDSMLSIHRSSSDQSQIRFTNTTTGEGGNNGLIVGIDNNEHGRIFNVENHPLRFGTNNTERVRITSDGMLNFSGQTSSTGTASISHHTNNNLYIRGGTSGLVLGNHDGTNIIHISNSNHISFETTDGTERLRINSTGKIGINNSAPLYPLHFKNAMTSTPSYIHMEVTGTNTVGGGGGIAFDTSASNSASNNGLYLATIKGIRNSADNGSNDLVFSTSAANVVGDDGNTHSPKEKLRITSTGRVGINTTTPSYKLHIKETTSASNYAFVENTTTGNAGVRLKNSQGDFVLFVSPDLRIYDFANSRDRLRISNSGRIGINADPTSYANSDTALGLVIKNGHTSSEHTFLDIQNGTSESGRIRFVDGDNGIAGQIYFSHNTNRDNVGANCMGFFTGNNTLRFTVTTTGAKVIGNTDGVFELDTSDGRGSFIRFQENGNTKVWVGCAEGMGGGLSSPDQDDLGLRAVGNILFSANGAERLRINESGGIIKGSANSATSSQVIQTFFNKRGSLIGKRVHHGSGSNSTAHNLLTINSWQSSNTRLFAYVTVHYVNPVSNLGGRMETYAAANYGGTRASGTFTVADGGRWGNPSGTLSLSWSGNTLQLNTFNNAYMEYSVDITYVAYDGASVSFATN